ncbi:MAG: TetR/AcrR family transcriptional regulator [Alphaproteobacteria bacterium]|nr:TetR/AcrR family transcriptional regulator [Alphaproteobacteria bacterium]MBN2780204.1 TetR/AcrR family transcriptional regulator [Alphaproteobacteria bacterium]
MAQKTGDLILKTASKLFSQKGFDGTSIRDIATKSGVNIAAISYHFGSKENLFFQVFIHAHKKFEKLFQSIPKDQSVSDFCFQMYQKLSHNHVDLLNSFRMLISQDLKPPRDPENTLPVLPPGAQLIFEVINAEIGKKSSESKRYWMSFIIFQKIFNTALFRNLKILEMTLHNYDHLVGLSEEEDLRLFIKRILSA